MDRALDGRHRGRAWACAALIAGAVAGGWPAGSTAAGEADVVRALETKPSEVRRFWTTERMQAAIPLGPVTAAAAPDAITKRGMIAKRVKRTRRFPNRTHGKVFLTLGGTDYVCSGTSVDAPSGRLVWTAGHCVYEPGTLGGSFATNLMFAPAYRDGETPFGEWPATALGTTQGWKNSGGLCLPGLSLCGDVTYDLGAATVATKGGRTLRATVGARGIDFNGPRDRTYKAVGYPQGSPFDGRYMYRCKSPWLGNDDAGNGPPAMRIRCDMTGGSSGGGWVTGGDVASVVSYGYNGEPNSLYGPYQGAQAQSLYNQVKNG